MCSRTRGQRVRAPGPPVRPGRPCFLDEQVITVASMSITVQPESGRPRITSQGNPPSRTASRSHTHAPACPLWPWRSDAGPDHRSPRASATTSSPTRRRPTERRSAGRAVRGLPQVPGAQRDFHDEAHQHVRPIQPPRTRCQHAAQPFHQPGPVGHTVQQHRPRMSNHPTTRRLNREPAVPSTTILHLEGASFHPSDQSSANRSSQVARHRPSRRFQSTHPARVSKASHRHSGCGCGLDHDQSHREAVRTVAPRGPDWRKRSSSSS